MTTKNNQENTRTLSEWFDPDNVDHIRAFNNLVDKGVWPDEFLSDDICVDNAWFAEICLKIAKKWVNYVIDSECEITLK